MTDKRQKATKVKCKRGSKRDESNRKESIFLKIEKASEFCWSLFAVEHKTLP